MQWRPVLHTTTIALAALLMAGSLPRTALAQGGGQPPAARQGGGARPYNAPPRAGGGIAFFGSANTSQAMNDPTRSAAMALLQRSDVQRSLELTIRQKQQLADIQNGARDDLRNRVSQSVQDLRNMTPEQRQAQRQQITEKMRTTFTGFTGELDQRTEAVLTPAQDKRLHELDLQWRGPLALLDPKVSESMGLTPEQNSKLNALLQNLREAQGQARQAAFQGFRPPNNGAAQGNARPQPPTPAEMQARMREAQERLRLAEADVAKTRKTLDAKALAVLTPDQQARWQALQGRPFVFLQEM